MKKKNVYYYKKTVYSFAEIMMIMLSALLLVLLFMAKAQTQRGFMQLVQSDITFNIVYLMSMFDVICFFELYYYGGKLKKNEFVESSILGILLIAIAQLSLLNVFVAGILIYFIYSFLNENNLKLKEIYRKVKDNHELKIMILNLILFTLTISMIYVMIHYRIMK